MKKEKKTLDTWYGKPENKILTWLYWNVYWRVWEIERHRFMSKFYCFLAKILEVINKKLEKVCRKKKKY